MYREIEIRNYSLGNRSNKRYIATQYISGNRIIVVFEIIDKKAIKKNWKTVVTMKSVAEMNRKVVQFFMMNHVNYGVSKPVAR